MSETDRIRVPTNGHRPVIASHDPGGPASGTAPAPGGDPPAGPDPRIAVSPGRLAAGIGILVGLVLLVVGGRRAADRSRDEDA